MNILRIMKAPVKIKTKTFHSKIYYLPKLLNKGLFFYCPSFALLFDVLRFS